MSVGLFAPAKVNLTLRVGPPGPDGRHPLDSLVVFTRTCGDSLQLEDSHELSLNIDGPFADALTAGEDNLIVRAAQILRDHAGINKGAKIVLTKALPIASGIGGGSADAAAALIGLNQLWGINASRQTLQDLGAALGADVPACVVGQALRMTGTGETIEAIPPLPALGIVLVNPLVPCPTGSVYDQYDRLGSFADTDMPPLPLIGSVASLCDYVRATPNDLEVAAIAFVPLIGEVLAAIAATPNALLTRMSGSGATCFGLYASYEEAVVAARWIKNSLASFPIWVEADEIN